MLVGVSEIASACAIGSKGLSCSEGSSVTVLADSITRRRFVWLAALAGGSLALGGCAGDGSNGADDSAGEGAGESQGPEDAAAAARAAADERIGAMTLEQKVAQLFIVTPEALVEGVSQVTQAGDMTREGVAAHPVGGIVYFAQNLLDPEQTTTMLANVKQFYADSGNVAPFVAVDEEGGTVVRVAGNEAFGVQDVGDASALGSAGDTEVAKRAGIENADRFVDARTLTSEEAVREAAGRYTVFGRVTPAQKRSLVQALKAEGHTVAMTGDGVNDVLALKEADCSIAMASGSDVACQVSHIVLLDSNFASMPSVVAEGRRVINNIERSASLYLVKNIFSFFLAFFTLFATLPYPFSPAQLTLVSAVTIGIPSFILAMEPNESLVKGKFLRNVLFRALPAAMTDLAMVVGILLFYIAFHLDDTAMITICTGVMGIVGLMMVHRTCQPYNTIRKVMIVVLGVLFVIAYFGFPTLFNLQKLDLQSALILIVFGLLSWPVMKAFCRLNDHMRARFEAWRAAKTANAA